eukprot:Skav206141  [mRNA]  locus=scaffold471:109080:114935:+ [translate_table: standard]
MACGAAAAALCRARQWQQSLALLVTQNDGFNSSRQPPTVRFDRSAVATWFKGVGKGAVALPAVTCIAKKKGTQPMLHSSTGVLGWTIRLALLAQEKKCFGEQAAKLELLVVELSASESSKVGVTVLSPHATIFSEHDRQQVKTARDHRNDSQFEQRVLLGPEAKDYSQIAKKDKGLILKGCAAKVADRLGHYHSNLLYIRAREERMRHGRCQMQLIKSSDCEAVECDSDRFQRFGQRSPCFALDKTLLAMRQIPSTALSLRHHENIFLQLNRLGTQLEISL